jgi:Truncated hemoglobins
VAEVSVFDALGGMAFFEGLVDRFYDGVAADPVLLAVYPHPEELAPARRHLALFLAQYWGGPDDYNIQRGHPALRRRHLEFPIGPTIRDRWSFHMREAVTKMQPPPAIADAMLEYFQIAAESLRNLEEDPGGLEA